MIASTCMVAAQLWQWRRLEGRTQRRGSWRVSFSVHPDISVCKSSQFSIFWASWIDGLNAILEMTLAVTTELSWIWASEILYTSHFSWGERWTPAMCDDGWLTLTRFCFFPPPAKWKRFRFQLTIQSAPTEWWVWQQSVRVTDLFWLIINISVGPDQ